MNRTLMETARTLRRSGRIAREPALEIAAYIATGNGEPITYKDAIAGKNVENCYERRA
jgi:hypothetical protein